TSSVPSRRCRSTRRASCRLPPSSRPCFTSRLRVRPVRAVIVEPTPYNGDVRIDREAPMSDLVIPKLRSPIVLVHGLLGFGRYQVGGYTLANYFPGIAELLEAAGNRVLLPNLS